jgi:hypothetical protein
MIDQIVRDANQLTSQRLVSHYLPTSEGNNVWTHEDACLAARRIPNRYGVPPDATTWRYTVQHPEMGWTFAIRAVWRCGKLMAPFATHVVIECYNNDDEAQLPDEGSAALAVNDWLRSLCL